jgi:hypothetical protein
LPKLFRIAASVNLFLGKKCAEGELQEVSGDPTKFWKAVTHFRTVERYQIRTFASEKRRFARKQLSSLAAPDDVDLISRLT